MALRAVGGNRHLLAPCEDMVALPYRMSLTSNFVGPFVQDVDHASDAVVGLLDSCR